MLSLSAISELLSDDELRGKFRQLMSDRTKSEMKSLQSKGVLLRKILWNKAQRGDQIKTGNHERVLKMIVSEHLDYFTTLTKLSGDFSDRLLVMLAEVDRDKAGEQAAAPAVTMNLQGKVGTTLRAQFEIVNSRDVPVTAIFKLTPYVSEDGSQLIAAQHAFDPLQVEIPKNGKQRATFIQPIAGFTPGTEYIAMISVEGVDTVRINVRLCVEPMDESVVVLPASAEAKSGVETGIRPKSKSIRKPSAKKSAVTTISGDPPSLLQPEKLNPHPKADKSRTNSVKELR
jgi:hypothetical protein